MRGRAGGSPHVISQDWNCSWLGRSDGSKRVNSFNGVYAHCSRGHYQGCTLNRHHRCALGLVAGDRHRHWIGFARSSDRSALLRLRLSLLLRPSVRLCQLRVPIRLWLRLPLRRILCAAVLGMAALWMAPLWMAPWLLPLATAHEFAGMAGVRA